MTVLIQVEKKIAKVEYLLLLEREKFWLKAATSDEYL